MTKKYNNKKNVELYHIWTIFEENEKVIRVKIKEFLEDFENLDTKEVFIKLNHKNDIKLEKELIDKLCSDCQEKDFYTNKLSEGYDEFVKTFLFDKHNQISTNDLIKILKRLQCGFREQ